MNSPKPVLGLTMGDPAGIGPELCFRALQHPSVLDRCTPVLFGDAGLLRRMPGSISNQLNCDIIPLEKWPHAIVADRPLIIDCAAADVDLVRPGEVTAACGRAGYIYIEQSIQAAMAGRIHGVVTAPIHKEALRLAGVPHPGHTEIFTALTGARRSCMMLRSPVLTVSMVTTHIGYAEVPARLNSGRIKDVIELTQEALLRILGRKPRLAICGLNPHAGEHGLFGHREEERLILPAVRDCRKQNIQIEGPLPPDTAFTSAQRDRFDGIVTLYHDQGHIPFKMLAFDTGVNITLGLPIVRTSVDHGTAFDIAWKGQANPQSLFEAVAVAAELVNGPKAELAN